MPSTCESLPVTQPRCLCVDVIILATKVEYGRRNKKEPLDTANRTGAALTRSSYVEQTLQEEKKKKCDGKTLKWTKKNSHRDQLMGTGGEIKTLSVRRQ